MPTPVSVLAELIHAKVVGDSNRHVSEVAALTKAGPSAVTFLNDDKQIALLKKSTAGAAIVHPRVAEAWDAGGVNSPTLLVVDDPQIAFIEVMERLRPSRPRAQIGKSPQAFIHPTATIGENCNLFSGVYISEGVEIGADCDLYPGVYVGPGCRINQAVTLFPNVVLYADVVIGSGVIIHSGAVLGADGFGYRFADGRFQKIPHRGTVVIEDDVEIGACTTIDRGMIGATVIGKGTKLDNHVMIGHNCEIGRHNVFVSQVGLAGSVTSGDYVRCAGQVGIADHVHLGDGCVIGAKAGIHKSVPAGQTYHGSPAGPDAEQRRIAMAQRKLPEMRKQLRELQTQVGELTAQMAVFSRQTLHEPTTMAISHDG